jgi:hypothetical protein
MNPKEQIAMKRTRDGLKIFQTQSGFDVKQVYRPGDVSLIWTICKPWSLLVVVTHFLFLG